MHETGESDRCAPRARSSTYGSRERACTHTRALSPREFVRARGTLDPDGTPPLPAARPRSDAHYLPTRPFTPPYTRHVDLPGGQHFDARRFRERGTLDLFILGRSSRREGGLSSPCASGPPRRRVPLRWRRRVYAVFREIRIRCERDVYSSSEKSEKGMSKIVDTDRKWLCALINVIRTLSFR